MKKLNINNEINLLSWRIIKWKISTSVNDNAPIFFLFEKLAARWHMLDTINMNIDDIIINSRAGNYVSKENIKKEFNRRSKILAEGFDDDFWNENQNGTWIKDDYLKVEVNVNEIYAAMRKAASF